MSRYVALTTPSIENKTRQTFVFEGGATLDEVFKQIADRERENTISYLDRLQGIERKVFTLTISRDESTEPTHDEKDVVRNEALQGVFNR